MSVPAQKRLVVLLSVVVGLLLAAIPGLWFIREIEPWVLHNDQSVAVDMCFFMLVCTLAAFGLPVALGVTIAGGLQ